MSAQLAHTKIGLRGFLFGLSLLSVLAPAAAFARDDDKDTKLNLPPYTGPRKRIAVADIEVKTSVAGVTQTGEGGANPAGVTADISTGLTEMLISALTDSQRYVVLERKAMTDITTEQTLSTGAGFNPATANATGKMLGAQILIRGAVTEFGMSQSNQGANGLLSGLGLTHNQAEAYVAIDMRIFDVATGQIIDSVRGEGRVHGEGTGISFNLNGQTVGDNQSNTSPLSLAARKAIISSVRQICARTEKIPWEGRVADVDGDGTNITTVYVSAGSSSGVKIGDEFEIFHPGAPIIDPDSQTVVGRKKDSRLGHGKVTNVTATLATVQITDGGGMAAGDVVKFSTAASAPTTPAPAPSS